MDDELTLEHERLTDELLSAKARVRVTPGNEAAVSEVERLSGELRDLEAEIRTPENSIKFVFQSIGPKKYDKLQSSFPATKEQKEELEARGMDPESVSYDVQAFSAALIAECSLEPKMDLDFVKDEIQNCTDGTWSTGDFNSLYSAAVDANLRNRSLNLGNASGRTKGSKRS